MDLNNPKIKERAGNGTVAVVGSRGVRTALRGTEVEGSVETRDDPKNGVHRIALKPLKDRW